MFGFTDDNLIFTINELEEEASEQRQQVKSERFCSLGTDGGEEEVKKRNVEEGREIESLLPEIKEEIVKEGKDFGESNESEEGGEDASNNENPSFQKIEDKSRNGVGTCPNEEADTKDQEPSLSLESLSLTCYELEDAEEHEFEYLEVENKIDSFQGSIGFAIFRRKN